MTMAELDRFANALNADWALRAEAEQYETMSDQNDPPLVRMAAFAATKGYSFTHDEARTYAKAKAEDIGLYVSDADLEAVTGFPYAGGVLGIITGDF